RRPPRMVRDLRRARGDDEGGDRAGGRRLRHLVRAGEGAPACGRSDRGARHRLGRDRDRRRHPAFQPRRAELLRALPRGRRPVAAIALLAAAAGNVFLGARSQATKTHVTRHDRIAARALRLIPGNAVVSATNSLGAHLSARRRFLSFPIRADATWIAVDQTKPGYLDRNDPAATARALAALRRDPPWPLVF